MRPPHVLVPRVTACHAVRVLLLNLLDCISPGAGQWSGLLEGGTWVTTGAALGGARSLVGATDQTPVSSLLARVAECLRAAVLLGEGDLRGGQARWRGRGAHEDDVVAGA